MNKFRFLYAFALPEGDEGTGDGGGGEASTETGGTDYTASVGNESVASSFDFMATPEDTGKTEDSGDSEFLKALPEEYREKPLFKDMKSVEDLAKWADNANGLIGKKTIGVPADDAPTEDWEKYYESVRPKEASEYEFADIEVEDDKKAMYEALKSTRSEKLQEKMRGVFHKAGLTKHQVSIINNGFELAQLDEGTALAEIAAEQDRNFDELADKTFGPNRTKAIESAKGLLEKYAPKEVQGRIGSMASEDLIAIAATLNGIMKDYAKEDWSAGTKGNQTPNSTVELRAEARRLMVLPEYGDDMHPQHDAVVQKVNRLYEQMRG